MSKATEKKAKGYDWEAARAYNRSKREAKGYDWEAARAYNRSKREAKATGIPRGSVNGNS